MHWKWAACVLHYGNKIVARGNLSSQCWINKIMFFGRGWGVVREYACLSSAPLIFITAVLFQHIARLEKWWKAPFQDSQPERRPLFVQIHIQIRYGIQREYFDDFPTVNATNAKCDHNYYRRYIFCFNPIVNANFTNAKFALLLWYRRLHLGIGHQKGCHVFCYILKLIFISL